MDWDDAKPLVFLGGAIALLVPLVWWLWSNTLTCDETCTFSGKRYDPAHWYYWTSYYCVSHDKSGVCTLSIPIQHQDWVPDRWWVQYRDSYGGLDMESLVGNAEYANPPQQVANQHTRWKKCPSGAEWSGQ